MSDSPKPAGRPWDADLIRIAMGLILVTGCGRDADSRGTASPGTNDRPEVTADVRLQVDLFCGNCHVVPRPDSFPKDMWHEEVRRGFDFYFDSGRSDLQVPVVDEVARYFRDRAPQDLVFHPSPESPSPIDFHGVDLTVSGDESDHHHAISFVSEHISSGEPAWWVSDMKTGLIMLLSVNGDALWVNNTAASNPVAVRPCDLDNDGQQDLLCTDLGSFPPEDHDRGKLVWIRSWGLEEQQEVVLLKDIGRVADVRVLDIDSDGGHDLAVAEFGWRKTGGIHLLRQTGTEDDNRPVYEAEVIDDHPGTIHLEVTDLNGDEQPDLVALISQEHEQIVAFVNDGSGFTRTVLYQAPDPSFGSSGISIVDFDQDGDEDVVYTNGDTFDSQLVKPFHEVSWLENLGQLSFKHHSLKTMPGVHRALAADLDLDGDLDIAAVALLPEETAQEFDKVAVHAVIWLEQTTAGNFEKHVISAGRPIHAAMALSDIDGDGDMDIVAGSFQPGSPSPKVRLFVNGTRTAASRQ